MDSITESRQTDAELKRIEGLDNKGTCNLCGVVDEREGGCIDNATNEWYCTGCLEDGHVAYYLNQNEYTSSEIKSVINNIIK